MEQRITERRKVHQTMFQNTLKTMTSRIDKHSKDNKNQPETKSQIELL